MESIKNTFKVNISPIRNLREFVYLTSGQAILKAIKSSLNDNPRPPITPPKLKSNKETNSIHSYTGTTNKMYKKTLIQSATALKKTPLDISNFYQGTTADMSNKI